MTNRSSPSGFLTSICHCSFAICHLSGGSLSLLAQRPGVFRIERKAFVSISFQMPDCPEVIHVVTGSAYLTMGPSPCDGQEIPAPDLEHVVTEDRKSTRLNSSHVA